MVFVGTGANEFEDLVAAGSGVRPHGNRGASPREFVMPM